MYIREAPFCLLLVLEGFSKGGFDRTCDAAVAIPLVGKTESLNVSVAAAVLLFEARRQRHG